MKEFPTLYKADSKGKIQLWRCWVEQDQDGSGVICVEHGRQGGALQTSRDTVTKGKNIGKVNETTAYQQACSEAESKWTKQQERKGYVLSVEATAVDSRPGYEPMLAHRFDQHPEKITFPAFMQPKLNGHRSPSVVDDGIARLFSRKREEITGLPHIQRDLELYLPKAGIIMPDGELYNHEYKDRFEQLTSFIRSKTPKEGHEVVQYHLYDVNIPLPFASRKKFLEELFSANGGQLGSLRLVETIVVQNEEDVREAFRHFRNQGYEGGILRNAAGIYIGRRSYDLQKVKEFVDEDFKVIGVKDGRGKFEGAAIFVCELENGETFDVTMATTMEERQRQFREQDKYIGKMLTVSYQNRSEAGVPIFPVGVQFRGDD